MNDNPWWCPHCRVGVDNRGILQDMRHVFCGNQVIPMETLPDRDKLIATLEAENAELKQENLALKARLFPNPRIIHGKGTGWSGTDAGIKTEWEAE